jgi:hypothetical protein
MSDSNEGLPLSLPSDSTTRERRGFKSICALLAEANPEDLLHADHAYWINAAGFKNTYDQPVFAAAAHVAIDLVQQGWTIRMTKRAPHFAPPAAGSNREVEKVRVRNQEHLRRDEQLRKPSVRRFVESMEKAHLHRGCFVSVFDLMRDGRDLADSIASAEHLSEAIDPYVQIVDESHCELSGFRLQDIWRYFRHTWSNAYSTVPGRSMPILVRDASTAFHTIIGIAAISSPVVQIAERDKWIGWETDQFIAATAEQPTARAARWFAARIASQLSEIYTADLLRSGVIEPSDLRSPTPDLIGALALDAERHKLRHHRNTVVRRVKSLPVGAWIERAETDLFRSKRSAVLAEVLEATRIVSPYLSPSPTKDGLSRALADPRAKAQLRKIVRRARGERVGTVIADLTVCGAVAPYNALAAGKLVAALAVSPTVLRAYRDKYQRPSEIASAMAGRAITREARLAFVGTTSLYGTGSSQYNRLFWPGSAMGGAEDDRMGFHELGRSRSFGTSHFGDETVEALVRLSALAGSNVRVNSLFGEGVSPRLRKVRIGLSALGWPTDELLKHGRERIVYGVPLVRNLRDYSLGIDSRPQYLLDPKLTNSDRLVAQWWLDRWCVRRSQQNHVIDALRSHSTVRPIKHGARVPLPPSNSPVQLEMDDSLVSEG